MKKLTVIFIAVLLTALSINAETWKFDKSHTTIGFEVSHMVISSVDGKFKEYDGTVTTDGDNWETAQINFTAQVNSIDTDNEDRDNHLKSDDFFAAEQFPEMTFVGKSMKKVGDNKYELTGDLTIRGTTKEVTLDVEHNGTVTDPWGNVRAGFSIEGVVNRFDYGLKWNNTLDTGGLVVGEEVELKIEAELVQQK
jgi:polyisoprenoid-binding protein YceI